MATCPYLQLVSMKKFFLSYLTSFLFLLGMSPAQTVELDKILRRGKLVIAVKDNVRPLGFSSREGQLQG